MYDTAAIGKADGEDATLDLAETEMTFLAFTVLEVFGDYAARIGECILCAREKATPCFSWFSASLFSSHSNRALFMPLH